MANLRVIGDIHGNIPVHNSIAKEAEYSVQLGDMGFEYKGLNELKPWCHRFFGGNHDNYDIYYHNRYALGDYGMAFLGDVDFFYVRGAFSIDKEHRLYHDAVHNTKSWWEKEQLGQADCLYAEEAYSDYKPDIMITHTCPTVIAKTIGNPGALKAFGYEPDTFTTRTQKLLQRMYDIHQPKLWIFGHFHMDRVVDLYDTKFVCLPEFGYVDIDSEGNIV